MRQGEDCIIVDLLPDGRVKITTDEVSSGNHRNAEGMLRFLQGKLGGTTETTRRTGGERVTGHTHGGVTHSH